jgi:hypothetical protein
MQTKAHHCQAEEVLGPSPRTASRTAPTGRPTAPPVAGGAARLPASPPASRAETPRDGRNVEISLEGKVALVTGAGPNIGSGIALALARTGAHVAAADIDAGAAKETADAVSALGRQLQARLATGPKGAVGGPRATVDRVLARTTDIWNIGFRGGEIGSIRVDGDGDTDLDCYVYSGGRLVAVDNDYTDYCILDWYQGSTGTVRLEIRNLGAVYNQYVLTTN